jgi:hypothetical protein
MYIGSVMRTTATEFFTAAWLNQSILFLVKLFAPQTTGTIIKDAFGDEKKC